MDATRPLLRATTLRMNRIVRWNDFKYEKCPDFFCCCGIMGHNEKSCKDKRGSFGEVSSVWGIAES